MTALINWLYRTGIKRGSTGKHWSWFVVALAAHILRRERRRIEEPPLRMDIKPGESIVVTMRDLGTSADS
jgi:hypothetical protein